MAKDSELISRAASGDEQAFADLMRVYYAFVYRIVIEIVSNPHDAEEVVQDTFLNAYCGLGQIEERARFRNWLAKIARNRALNWRRERRADTVPIDDVGESALQYADSPDEQLIRDEQRELIRRAMNTLSQKDRDIARAYYLGGASYDELIRTHGLSYKAISFRLSRAKRTLAKRLQYLLTGAFVPPATTLKKITSGGFTAMKIGTVPKITVGVIAIVALVFIGSRQLLSPREDSSLSIAGKPMQSNSEIDTASGSVVTAPLRRDEPQISAEEMEQIEDFFAQLEAMEDETALEQTTASPDFFNGTSSGSEEDGNIEDIDFPQRKRDPGEVEAIITAIYENTENYREILLTTIDLYEGRAYLHPETASPDYPEQLQLRSEEVRMKASELWGEYLLLTKDFDAFNPGGWINEAYSGMATLSGNASTKRITTFFSDDMLAEYE